MAEPCWRSLNGLVPLWTVLDFPGEKVSTVDWKLTIGTGGAAEERSGGGNGEEERELLGPKNGFATSAWDSGGVRSGTDNSGAVISGEDLYWGRAPTTRLGISEGFFEVCTQRWKSREPPAQLIEESRSSSSSMRSELDLPLPVAPIPTPVSNKPTPRVPSRRAFLSRCT